MSLFPILPDVFKMLDNESKKQARLVCPLWEMAMARYGELSITVNDQSPENRNFIRRVPNPKSIQIIHLNQMHYDGLKETFNPHLLKRFQISGLHEGPLFAKAILPFTNLTALLLVGKLFWSTNFQSGISPILITERSLFPCLEVLKLIASDMSIKRDFKLAFENRLRMKASHLQNVSQNFQFLLKNIGARKLREVWIDDDYTKERGLSLARKGSHWENEELVKFLSFHSSSLRILHIVYMPFPLNGHMDERVEFPLNLKVMTLCTWCNLYSQPLLPNSRAFKKWPEDDIVNLMPDPEHAYRMEILENFDGSFNRKFWIQAILSQKNLKWFYYNFHEPLNWRIYEKLVFNNRLHLRKVWIVADFVDGFINCELFENTGIQELKIVHRKLHGTQCLMHAMEKLPRSLKKLVLKNVEMPRDTNLMTLQEFPRLEVLILYTPVENTYQNNDYMKMLHPRVLRDLLRLRKLKILILVGFHTTGVYENSDLTNSISMIMGMQCKIPGSNYYRIKIMDV